jgi:hypothetical protein
MVPIFYVEHLVYFYQYQNQRKILWKKRATPIEKDNKEFFNTHWHSSGDNFDKSEQ